MTTCVDWGQGVVQPRRSTCFGYLIGLVFVSLATTSNVQAQQNRLTNPYGRDVEFTVAVRENQSLIGELALHMAQDGSLSVTIANLASALVNRITPEAAQSLLQLEAHNGRVSVDALMRLGYRVTFNDAELELTIGIPLSVRPSRDYSVIGPQQGQLGDFDPVAGFSVAANLRLAGDYTHSDFSEAFSSSGNLNIVGRTGPVAYQSSFRIPQAGFEFLHEGSRLIYDDIKNAIRWQLGDIRPFSSSPLGGDDILGFGVSSEKDILQSDQIARVRGAQTFSIEEPSEVTISVNGRIVSRRLFAPGNYNIADFPFVLGRNQIELLIQNPAGEQELLRFNQFLDSRLLEAGRNDFGLVIGVASRPGFNQARQYDAANWTLNGHYIKGVSERVTLGIAATHNRERNVILATGVYAGSAGVTSGRLGLNLSQSGSQTATLGLGLVRALNGQTPTDATRTFRFGLDGRVDFKDTGKNLLNASIGYAWPLNQRMLANIDLRISGQNGSTSFQTSYSLTREIRLDVSLDWRFNKSADLSGPGISIGLSRSFGTGGQARARYDSWVGESRLSVSTTPQIGLGQWSNTVEAATSSNSSSISTAQSALFNRLEVATFASAAWRDGRSSQRVSMRSGSAIAFANGQLALGRPVSDSFAIIAGHKTLGNRVISLTSRGTQSGTMARTGLFGPALVSNLGTYGARVVSVSVDDPPEGYDIGSGTFRVQPPLFGGYGFIVGSDTANSVIGTLVLANGQPAALIAGAATSPDWPNLAPITVFTNASGQFSISGLGRGRWSLRMRDTKGTFDFVIGASETSFIQVGSIRAGGVQ